MRHSCLLVILLLSSFLRSVSASPIDSLHTALSHAATPSEQLRIYRNLADATTDTPESRGYLFRLIEQAKAAQQTQPLMEATTDLVLNYILFNELDSARHYTREAEKHLPQQQSDQWCSNLRMRIFANELVGKDPGRAVNEKIEEFKTYTAASERPFKQIEAEFNVAMALELKGQQQEAIAHLQKALETAETIPFREGAPYQILILYQAARLNNAVRQTQIAADLTKTAIEIRERYYERYEKPTRPFLSLDRFYVVNYASLLINVQQMSDKEARHYLDRLVELTDRSQEPLFRYNRFHAQFNYCVTKKDLPQAVSYNDSLIYYARRIAVYNLPNLYNIRASIFEILGKDKEALDNFRISHQMRDSIRQNDLQTQIDQMRVEYDVTQLNYERSQLQIRNNRIQLITLLVALVVVGILCIQLSRHLKRERKQKRHIQQLKLQAEESEKLKTIFISSVCHEIRSPLDAITDSTSQLLDPTLTEEVRRKQPEEIIHNTTILLTLIDSMLEVSSLNVSEEKLPRKPVDVAELCRKAFERYTLEPKNGIISLAQLPNQPLVIPTNDRYLPLVIENLLSNAYKFTQRGSVTLCCERRTSSVVISVTDTGCGIPDDKRNEVFERFTKLNPNIPGNGLGLYLCRVIVEKLSGSIHIDSGYTKGTRIVVTLSAASSSS